MKKNKKIILGLGSMAMIIAPLATVVSCGKGDDKKTPSFKIKNLKDAFDYSFREVQKNGGISFEEKYFEKINEGEKIVSNVNAIYKTSLPKTIKDIVDKKINSYMQKVQTTEEEKNRLQSILQNINFAFENNWIKIISNQTNVFLGSKNVSTNLSFKIDVPKDMYKNSLGFLFDKNNKEDNVSSEFSWEWQNVNVSLPLSDAQKTIAFKFLTNNFDLLKKIRTNKLKSLNLSGDNNELIEQIDKYIFNQNTFNSHITLPLQKQIWGDKDHLSSTSEIQTILKTLKPTETRDDKIVPFWKKLKNYFNKHKVKLKIGKKTVMENGTNTKVDNIIDINEFGINVEATQEQMLDILKEIKQHLETI